MFPKKDGGIGVVAKKRSATGTFFLTTTTDESGRLTDRLMAYRLSAYETERLACLFLDFVNPFRLGSLAWQTG